MRVAAVGQIVKTYPTIQCKFLHFFLKKMRVPEIVTASHIQLYELWIAVMW